MGVVHDRGCRWLGRAVRAGGEIVREAEGVAGLVRGELTGASQAMATWGEVLFLDKRIAHSFAYKVRGRFGDEVVLAAAEGA